MAMVDVDGEDFFVRESGAGEPALVLHGGPGIDHSYMRGLDVLSDRLRLVYADQRGDGRSTKHGLETPGMQTFARDADHLIASLNLAPAIVIGHSHGASVALELALANPAAVRALVLVGGVPAYDYEMSRPSAVLDRLDDNDRVVLQRPVKSDEDLRKNFLARVRLTAGDDASADRVRAAFEDVRCSVRMSAVLEAINDNWSAADRLADISCPALVVGGELDWVSVPARCAQLAAALPAGELALIEGCGHFPWIETPERFESVVRIFLDRLDPVPANLE